MYGVICKMMMDGKSTQNQEPSGAVIGKVRSQEAAHENKMDWKV